MMMRKLAAAGVVLLLSGAWTVAAGASLKSVMKLWKVDANATAEMLNGSVPYDEAAARNALQAFIADSQAIDARLTGATPANKDIKLRFEKFNADATAAMSLTSANDRFKTSFGRLMNDCKSCHDQYAR
jgi:cytochrome c556